jgi:hypothetical protein
MTVYHRLCREALSALFSTFDQLLGLLPGVGPGRV